MKTDTQRLDFMQRHPRCVAAWHGPEGLGWSAVKPSPSNDAKNFSSLRDAIDYAMSPASGIAPGDLAVGDYCEAKVRQAGSPECWNIRLCRVEETHGHILKVATATRKSLVAMHRDDVVGLGWRKA